MKKIHLIAAIAALPTLVSCGPSAEEIAKQKAEAELRMQDSLANVEMSYAVDAAASIVKWSGNMTGIQAYSHFGDLKLVSGSVSTKGGALVGGEFTVDMKSINPLDSGYSAEHPREGLIGHLGTADFFAVDSFPTASLKITAVDGASATADLTVRGRTNSETITDLVITPNADGTLSASGKLSFDRQKYGVAYKSTVKDLLLADAIELTVELKGNAQ
jgi:polyisoprenoid-binding protein YceI